MRFNSSCDQINNDTQNNNNNKRIKINGHKKMPILTNRVSVREWNV